MPLLSLDDKCYCPFGCTRAECDDHGYCDHLVGFSSDGITYEPRGLNKMGREMVDGRKPKKVTDEHELVNPLVEQVVHGVTYKVSKWHDSRVYAKAKPVAEETKPEKPKRQLTEEQKEKARANLAAARAAKKAKLDPVA